MNSCEQECIIDGCKSNLTDNKTLRFFPYPNKDTTEHKIWMLTCFNSCEKINSLAKPIVCELHFAPEEMCQERLHPNAFPRLNLPKAYYDGQDVKEKKTDYVGNILWDWILRSQCYHSITRKMVSDVTRFARELLNMPPYVRTPLWIKTFKNQPILPDVNGVMHAERPFKKFQVVNTLREIVSLNRYKPVQNKTILDADKGCEIPKLETTLVKVEVEEDASKERTIESYEDALEYLKPLQYFVSEGREHFSAIGLLEQLQTIFKNPD